MGFAFVVSPCIVCHTTMTYNPNTVPSTRVNGVREPICRSCVEAANPLRVAKGLPPINVAPDAYEACDERDL